jgi:hypothetical protein
MDENQSFDQELMDPLKALSNMILWIDTIDLSPFKVKKEIQRTPLKSIQNRILNGTEETLLDTSIDLDAVLSHEDWGSPVASGSFLNYSVELEESIDLG